MVCSNIAYEYDILPGASCFIYSIDSLIDVKEYSKLIGESPRTFKKFEYI